MVWRTEDKLPMEANLMFGWCKVAVPIVLVIGCSGRINAGGNGDGGGAGAVGAGSSGGGAPGSATVFKGYVEAFMFASGSDAVTMNLAFASDGTVTGTVLFGDGPPLPPPMDPSKSYPPNLPPTGNFSPEGFRYTVLQGKYAAPRVTLEVDIDEVYKKWCEIQTSYPYYNGGPDGGLLGYECLPNGGYSGNGSNCQVNAPNGPPIIVDCVNVQLCSMESSPCTCTPTGCTRMVGPKGGVTFDMQLMGNALNGSVSGILGASPLNVHLTSG